MRSILVWTVVVLAAALPVSALAAAQRPAAGWQVLATATRMPTVYDPAGLAIGPGGTVYLADVGNNRILKLSADGRQLAAWPLPLLPATQPYFHVLRGQPYAQLPSAGIAVDTGGNVYVATTDRGLRKLSSRGRLLATWDVPSPAIAADRAGNVFTVSQGKIQKRSSSGAVLATWPVPDPDGQHAGSVMGLAVAPSGDVFADVAVIVVPDPNTCYRSCPNTISSYIQRFSASGQPGAVWGWKYCTEFTGSCTGSPVPIAVGPGGSVYIADQDENSVSRYGPAGMLLGKWGSEGSNPGLFQAILGLTVDPRGHVIVADAENGRLQVLGPEGQPLAQWGGGSALGQMNTPAAVAVAPDGTAYVADQGNRRIEEIDPSGRAVRAWGLSPVRDSAGNYRCGVPTGLATDSRGALLVTESYACPFVFKYSSTGKLLARLDLGNFSGVDVAVGGGGNIFVTGYSTTHRLLKVSPGGHILAGWPATLDLSTDNYSAVAVDRQGNVYLSHNYRSEVVKLSPSLRNIAALPGFALPLGLATDPQGNLYVADNGENLGIYSSKRQAVYKFSPTGHMLAQWAQKGPYPGQIHDPDGVAVDPRGRWLYVADTGNNRVQRLALGGR